MPRRVGEDAQDRQRDEVADAPRATEGQPYVVQGLSAPMTRRNPHVTEPPWDLLNAAHSSHFCCARARFDRCPVCRSRDTVHPLVLCVAPTACTAVVCRPGLELRGGTAAPLAFRRRRRCCCCGGCTASDGCSRLSASRTRSRSGGSHCRPRRAAAGSRGRCSACNGSRGR